MVILCPKVRKVKTKTHVLSFLCKFNRVDSAVGSLGQLRPVNVAINLPDSAGPQQGGQRGAQQGGQRGPQQGGQPGGPQQGGQRGTNKPGTPGKTAQNINQQNRPKTSPPGRFPSRDQRKDLPKVELTEEEIQRQIKETLQRLSGAGKSKASKHRREKRHLVHQQMQDDQSRMDEEKSILKVTEFVYCKRISFDDECPSSTGNLYLHVFGYVCFKSINGSMLRHLF